MTNTARPPGSTPPADTLPGPALFDVMVHFTPAEKRPPQVVRGAYQPSEVNGTLHVVFPNGGRFIVAKGRWSHLSTHPHRPDEDDRGRS